MVDHVASAIECLFEVSPSTARILATDEGALLPGLRGTRPAAHWLTSKVSYPWRHDTVAEACEALVAREIAPADLLDASALRRWQCDACARHERTDWWLGCRLCSREGGEALPPGSAELLAVAALGRRGWETAEANARAIAFAAPRPAAVAWRPMTGAACRDLVNATQNGLLSRLGTAAVGSPSLAQLSILHFNLLRGHKTPPRWVKGEARAAWPALHELARLGVVVVDQTGAYRDFVPVVVLGIELPPWSRAAKEVA